MPKIMKTKRVSSLRARYKQTGGSLAMAWVHRKCKCKCHCQKKKKTQKKNKTLLKKFQIMKGSVTDVKFIGFSGQKDWIGVELETFYVIIPGKTVVMFRRPIEPQFKLGAKDIVDHLEAELGIPPGAKLSYRGTEVPSDEDLAKFQVPKAAFLLATYWDPAHSGKLWTCLNQCCVDGPTNRRGFHRCVS